MLDDSFEVSYCMLQRLVLLIPCRRCIGISTLQMMQEWYGICLCFQIIPGIFRSSANLDGMGLCRKCTEHVFIGSVISHGKDKIVGICIQKAFYDGSLGAGS